MPHQRVQVSAIVAAGGRGERLGGSVPKQFLDLGGRSVLQRSVDAIGASGLVDEIVVALPEAAVAPGDVLRDDAAGCAVRIVAGGSRRQDSVASAFDAVAPESDVVLVHDAARPFVSRAVIARVIDEARLHGAAIAAVRSTDTVKRAAGRAGRPVIEATLAREDIWLAQTPQGFRYDVLRAAIDLGRSDDGTRPCRR
jgi:2-C-methyl-D-erythritol 4-phosphate cytidylyltransferase